MMAVAGVSLLPEELLVEVLSLVPPLHLIRRCRAVCRRWRDAVDCEPLWMKLCERSGYIPEHWAQRPRHWHKYYYLCSRRRNLLKNPCGLDRMKFWKLETNFGDSWNVEDLPGEEGQPFPDDSVTKYFVTSYMMCFKSQLIDLRKMGYSKELMDDEQPDITVRDWFSARQGMGCKYVIDVQLLDENKSILRKFYPRTVSISPWSDVGWQERTHTFKNYGLGARYVYFGHGGNGNSWNGVRVTKSSVTVEPQDLTVPPRITTPCRKRRKTGRRKKAKKLKHNVDSSGNLNSSEHANEEMEAGHQTAESPEERVDLAL